MLREAPRLPATAHDTGDWLHTAVYLAIPGHRVLLFPGARGRRGGHRHRRAARRRSCMPVPSGATDADPFRRAIVESVTAELLAAELWRRTSAEER